MAIFVKCQMENMNWIILIVAGFFESGFAFCLGKMKEVSGTEWYLWGAGFLVCLALSMVLLAKAVQTLPIGTAYPVWTGIGALGTVLGVHCMESNPYSDYAKLTYPIKGEYLISKRRYSAFFGTDLEILLKGLKANTTITYG